MRVVFCFSLWQLYVGILPQILHVIGGIVHFIENTLIFLQYSIILFWTSQKQGEHFSVFYTFIIHIWFFTLNKYLTTFFTNQLLCLMFSYFFLFFTLFYHFFGNFLLVSCHDTFIHLFLSLCLLLLIHLFMYVCLFLFILLLLLPPLLDLPSSAWEVPPSDGHYKHFWIHKH